MIGGSLVFLRPSLLENLKAILKTGLLLPCLLLQVIALSLSELFDVFVALLREVAIQLDPVKATAWREVGRADYESFEEVEKIIQPDPKRFLARARQNLDLAIVDLIGGLYEQYPDVKKDRCEKELQQTQEVVRNLTQTLEQTQTTQTELTAVTVVTFFCIVYLKRPLFRKLIFSSSHVACYGDEHFQQQQPQHESFADDESLTSNSDSLSSLASWILVGSGCFMPEALFTVEGETVMPARKLCVGDRVLAAHGRTTEVAAPPEQCRVHAIIELQAGPAFLVVSPDHRILIPGNKTVKAEELKRSDEVTGQVLNSCLHLFFLASVVLCFSTM